MCDSCRINKKDQLVKNLLLTAFHWVSKVSLNYTTLKIEWFSKGVWWLFPRVSKKQPVSVSVYFWSSINVMHLMLNLQEGKFLWQSFAKFVECL